MTTTMTTFDKLAYVDRLKQAGFDDAQARAHAEALDAALRGGVATKSDIYEIIRHFQEAEARLEAKIGNSAAQLRKSLIRWLIALMLVACVFFVGVVKFVKPAKHCSDCAQDMSRLVNSL
jgi:hypothetical protein